MLASTVMRRATLQLASTRNDDGTRVVSIAENQDDSTIGRQSWR